MYGYVYLTTNLVNGNKYIGKRTASSTEDDDYIGSGTLLKRAIKKYGVANFSKAIVCIAENRIELAYKEIEVILAHNAVNDPTYYNIAAGGDGGRTGDFEQYSDRMKRGWVDRDREEVAKHFSSLHKDKPKTHEHKQHLSESKTGKPRNWVNVTREEYSERRRVEYADGICTLPEGNRGNKDFRHTEESLKRQSEIRIEAHKRAVEERGQYVSPEGIEMARVKRNAHFTPERRQQYEEETRAARDLAEQARKEKADEYAKQFLPLIVEMQHRGLGMIEIAKEMNALGHKSRRGSAWTDQTVRQMLKRRPEPTPVVRKLDDEVFKPASRFVGWKGIAS